MNQMLGIDLSGPSTGWQPVPREWFRQVRADHPELEIVNVGLWTGGRAYDAADETLANARAEGWLTSAYYVVHDHLSPNYHFVRAMETVPNEAIHLKFLSVDVEKPDDAWQVSMGTIDESCDLVENEGLRAPVYSSYYMWNALGLGVMTRRRRIWNAYYDENPDIDYEKYPWGGAAVEDLMGEQFTGSTYLSGIAVDFNVFDRDYVLQGDDAMTAEDQAKIDAKFEGVRTIMFAAFTQINDLRTSQNSTVDGLKSVQAGLSSLADLVHNSVGGGPQQTDATKQAVADLRRITDKLLADRAEDAEKIAAAGELLANLGKENQ